MAPRARLGYTKPANFTSHYRTRPADPATETTYFIGAHRPHWLSLSPAPVCISLAQIVRYKGRDEAFSFGGNGSGNYWPPTMPEVAGGCAPYVLDSGAYTALMTNNPEHPWHYWPDEYGSLVVRVIEQNGYEPEWVAIQDAPCEPNLLAKTGRTVQGNQEETLESYLYLTEQFPFVPWLPTLQGWTVADYHRHADMYEAAGVDLSRCRTIGVGSVCRRDQLGPVEVLASLAARFPGKLHGFGVSMPAMRVVGHLLASADSMAWSDTARKEEIRLEGCEHEGVCNNCLSYALVWREEMLDAIRTSAAAAAVPQLAKAPAPTHTAVKSGEIEQLALFAA
jgi:hypothetical protein